MAEAAKSDSLYQAPRRPLLDIGGNEPFGTLRLINSAAMAQQSQQAIEYRDRVRWAARYIQIHRQHAFHTVANLRMSSVKAAGNGAGSGGDDELWLSDGLIGHQQSLFHIHGDRAGDQNAIGVTRRGDELDPEPAGVEDDIAERVCLDLASVATAGADLTQP